MDKVQILIAILALCYFAGNLCMVGAVMCGRKERYKGHRGDFLVCSVGFSLIALLAAGALIYHL